jgi:3-methyladenine DNA glycosylase Tag
LPAVGIVRHAGKLGDAIGLAKAVGDAQQAMRDFVHNMMVEFRVKAEKECHLQSRFIPARNELSSPLLIAVQSPAKAALHPRRPGRHPL